MLRKIVLAVVFLCFAPYATAQQVTVFGAASLKNALDALAAAFERARGAKVLTSYASSSTLAKQIEHGAPADVFISANVNWMDYLAQRKLIVDASRVDLLRNALVLVAPSTSDARVEIEPAFPLLKLLGSGKLAMGDPSHVPAGQYGKAALVSLGVWDSVSDRIAAADNVRAALALVSRREVPLGIVYATDAAADRGVRVVAEFPAGSHPPIVYPAALVAPGASPAAQKFLAYLRSREASPIFRKYGFVPIE
ncbi:MAG TPA: molybdate ABC transporter substrate-binding protein [Burkholderiales bacterium]|nr:molybdate ABC transporter substrate-binding protein [Burkholderiales bacterium]